jgi:hypothetical protein
MTRIHTRAPSLSAQGRRSLGWKQIEQTKKRPGDWEQTPTGFRRVP